MELRATSGPNGLKTEFDVKNTCRFCMKLNVDGKMTNIFDSNIIDKVLFCTGIQFSKDDGLPSNMCKCCDDDLAIAHRFKTSCLLANDTFQNIRDNIKTEVTTDDDFAYSDLDDEDDKPKLKEEISDDNVKDDIKIEIEIESEIRPQAETIQRLCKKTAKHKGSDVDTIKKQRRPRGPYKKKEKKEGKKTRVKKKYPPDYLLKRLSCDRCNLKFPTMALANLHKNTVHKDDLDPWICEICGQQFVHRGSLSTHMRTHFPPTFACNQCDYKAALKYDLSKHLSIHAGEQNYQCEMCPARFYTASNLSSHITRQHERRKRFACGQCERGFYDKTKYNRHLDSHLSIKRHECEFCHSAFTRRCYWKKHLEKQHNVIIPPERPGRQRKNLIVDEPVTEYVKPRVIKKDVSEEATQNKLRGG